MGPEHPVPRRHRVCGPLASRASGRPTPRAVVVACRLLTASVRHACVRALAVQGANGLVVPVVVERVVPSPTAPWRDIALVLAFTTVAATPAYVWSPARGRDGRHRLTGDRVWGLCRAAIAHIGVPCWETRWSWSSAMGRALSGSRHTVTWRLQPPRPHPLPWRLSLTVTRVDACARPGRTHRDTDADLVVIHAPARRTVDPWWLCADLHHQGEVLDALELITYWQPWEASTFGMPFRPDWPAGSGLALPVFTAPSSPAVGLVHRRERAQATLCVHWARKLLRPSRYVCRQM